MDVRLSTDASGLVVVEVNYQLEVNQLWAMRDAQILLEQRGEEAPGSGNEYYEAFARLHAPLLADRVSAVLDGTALDFSCIKRMHRLNSKDGTLHCDFVFRASAKPQTRKRHVLSVEEGAYKLEAGRVLLSLHADPPVNLLDRVQPSAELKARSPADLKIGDDERMRHGSLTFTLPGDGATAAPDSSTPTISPTAPPAKAAAAAEEANQPTSTLLDLLFDTRKGFALLLVLAAVFGAFHALTPGHGKTLVAAYLVGERGTLAHAALLGVVTTLTHTGAVLLLAGVLWFFPKTNAAHVQILLGLGGGLLVAGMGFWLLYRRLAGQADHFHFGGGHDHHHDHVHGHHHHHHGLADHYHDEHGHARPLPASSGPVGIWGLIVLGVSGGIVPCTDAIVMLIVAIGKGYLDRALPLLLAFSAGLAGVLIAIGMLVVTSKRFAGSHFGESRLFRALPILSAALVMSLGIWLCYDAVHGGIVPASNKP